MLLPSIGMFIEVVVSIIEWYHKWIPSLIFLSLLTSVVEGKSFIQAGELLLDDMPLSTASVFLENIEIKTYVKTTVLYKSLISTFIHKRVNNWLTSIGTGTESIYLLFCCT